MMRNLLYTCVALFLYTFSFGQTVTFETENGLIRETICRGAFVELNLDIDPPRPGGPTSTYNVQWERNINPTFIQNCPFPSPDESCSFFREAPQETVTYTVTVNGGPDGAVRRSIIINVEAAPNPGLNTTMFLCGRTGVINLFDELDGGPEAGGTWSNGTGTYDTADPNGGAFTYSVGGAACPAVSAVITVKPCGDNDSDDDGVPNPTDNDDDNDGIPDAIEDGFCTATTTTPIFVLEEDFGFGGPTRSRYSEGLGLTYSPGLPDDQSNNGEYNVATSTYFRTAGGFDATFLSSDLIGEVDANGDVDGRYLAINMRSSVFADSPVFVADNLPVTPGIEYNFSMSIASLNNNAGERPANLTIEVVDQATGIPIFSEDSGEIANGTDAWILVQDTFVPAAGVDVVTIRVINRQNIDGNGNDIGIDNIFLFTTACDFDRDGIPNSEDLDSDNDGIYDIVESGNAAADANGDGRFDGALNADGTSTTVTHNVINSDSDTNENFLDIDSDNDGIVDMIEGQSTAGFIASSGVDGDFNGVDDSYDTNGTPVVPVNTNTTADPDYIDTNSDPVAGDCLDDTIEAYDIDQDGVADIVLANADSDADGLDDAFDAVVLDRLTDVTNANNGGTVPADFPNNHNPLTPELDWREEIGDVDLGSLAITVCDPTNLFDELPMGVLTTGTWTVPAGGTALAGGHLGTLDPTIVGILDGEYIYTLPVLAAGCPPIRYLIDVTIDDACRCPDIDEPIVPVAPIVTCIDAVPLPSITVTLGSGLEGRWYLADGTPIARAQNTDTFTPDITELSLGDVIFRVEAYEPVGMCTSDLVDVTITVTAAPEAGVPNDAPPVPVTLCEGDTTVINLFDQLTGEDPGGVWTDPATTVIAGGTISADTNMAGDYTYTVTSNGCTDTAIITVIIELIGDVGLDGVLNTCTGASAVNLFDNLGGTPDTAGSWTDPNGDPFGPDDQGTFDPATDIAGVYTYTIGTMMCNASAIVTVSVGNGANSGENATEDFCTIGATTVVNLFDSLGGTPDAGGSWTDPNGDPFGGDDQGTLDPADPGALSGDYTYTVSTANCPVPSSSVVTVTIERIGGVGLDGVLNTCTGASAVNLFDSLGGTPDTAGSWTDPNGDPFGTDDQGTFDPATDIAGVYTYTIGTMMCNASAIVTVSVGNGANSGENATEDFCTIGSTVVNLFDSLGGTPDAGGSWTDPNGDPFGGDDQGTLDPADPGALSGDYTYTVSTANCPVPSSSVVTVTISTTPTLMLNTTVCSAGRSTYDVSFTTNGMWNISITPNGVGLVDATNSMITDIPAGIDIIISATNPANALCQETLSITAPDCSCPDITEPTNPIGANICFGDPAPTLSVEVAFGQTANWYDVTGALVQSNAITFTPLDTEPGSYTYRVEALDIAENCVSDMIEVIFSITDVEQIALVVDGVICVDPDTGISVPGNEGFPLISTFLDASFYTFQWSVGGTVIFAETGPQIQASQSGEYTVVYTDIASGCSNTSSVAVEEVPLLRDENLELSLSNGAFAASNDIIVTINRPGDYVYSLDTGSFQESNIFSNVSPGLRTVTVEDLSGCGVATGTIFVLGFPRFFTPNNDGMNDVWIVENSADTPDMNIYVFDRYGKLLTQLVPGQGWDGTYNGVSLPATDYWFTAELTDGSQTFRNHFTLKR